MSNLTLSTTCKYISVRPGDVIQNTSGYPIFVRLSYVDNTPTSLANSCGFFSGSEVTTPGTSGVLLLTGPSTDITNGQTYTIPSTIRVVKQSGSYVDEVPTKVAYFFANPTAGYIHDTIKLSNNIYRATYSTLNTDGTVNTVVNGEYSVVGWYEDCTTYNAKTNANYVSQETINNIKNMHFSTMIGDKIINDTPIKRNVFIVDSSTGYYACTPASRTLEPGQTLRITWAASRFYTRPY